MVSDDDTTQAFVWGVLVDIIGWYSGLPKPRPDFV